MRCRLGSLDGGLGIRQILRRRTAVLELIEIGLGGLDSRLRRRNVVLQVARIERGQRLAGRGVAHRDLTAVTAGTERSQRWPCRDPPCR